MLVATEQLAPDAVLAQASPAEQGGQAFRQYLLNLHMPGPVGLWPGLRQ